MVGDERIELPISCSQSTRPNQARPIPDKIIRPAGNSTPGLISYIPSPNYFGSISIDIMFSLWAFKLCPSHNWWPRQELNLRHTDFQSAALPTELRGQDKLIFCLWVLCSISYFTSTIFPSTVSALEFSCMHY